MIDPEWPEQTQEGYAWTMEHYEGKTEGQIYGANPYPEGPRTKDKWGFYDRIDPPERYHWSDGVSYAWSDLMQWGVVKDDYEGEGFDDDDEDDDE